MAKYHTLPQVTFYGIPAREQFDELVKNGVAIDDILFYWIQVKSVMKIIKYEIQFDKSLKQRLEFICEFSKVTSTFKGCIKKMEKTNLSYI